MFTIVDMSQERNQIDLFYDPYNVTFFPFGLVCGKDYGGVITNLILVMSFVGLIRLIPHFNSNFIGNWKKVKKILSSD